MAVGLRWGAAFSLSLKDAYSGTQRPPVVVVSVLEVCEGQKLGSASRRRELALRPVQVCVLASYASLCPSTLSLLRPVGRMTASWLPGVLVVCIHDEWWDLQGRRWGWGFPCAHRGLVSCARGLPALLSLSFVFAWARLSAHLSFWILKWVLLHQTRSSKVVIPLLP